MEKPPTIPSNIRSLLRVPVEFRFQEAGWFDLVAQLGRDVSAKTFSAWLTCADAATEILRARFDRYGGALH